jgi:hypothetical protein
LRGSRRDTVRSGNIPLKEAYTAHRSRKRAEQGFGQPYGKTYGLLACLMEYRTLRHGRAKSGAFWGSQSPGVAVRGGPLSRRCALMPVLAARSLITNRLENGNPTAGCVRRSLCVQNHMGFHYGLAKSRMENPQAMGRAGKTHGSCRCGPPLPDELRKSWLCPRCVRRDPAGSHAH